MNQAESSQAAAVRRQLVQLVGAHGPDLLDDARRVRAMLGDAVVGATAEANLIGLAISSGVPAKLRQGTAASAIVSELQQTSSVQPQDAEWAVSAIAAALGMAESAPPPPPPPAPPSPAAAPDAPGPAAAASGPAGPAGPDDLVIGGVGPDVVVRAGTTATIGRDPGSTLVLDSTAVSRLHARVERVGSGWEYTDLGSTQGSFVGGAAVRTTTITGSTEIVLGQGAEAVRLRFGPGVARPAPERARPDVANAAPPTEVPGRPGGVLAGGAPKTEVTGVDSLTVTLGGTTRVIASGGALTIGRESDNDLMAPGSTASRHHARIEQTGGTWVLRDLGSSSGTWLAGQRVTEATLTGQQEFVLGDPGRGDHLTTQAPGSSPASHGGGIAAVASAARSWRGKGPAWVVPAAAAAVVVLVLGVVAVGLRAHHGGSGADRLTDAQLAEATVELVRPDGIYGSGVVVDAQKGLIMTNAHVAVSSALGQGLPKFGQDTPQMQSDLPKNPAELVVYVSSDGKSAALPKFWARPVAWDGYLDVAVLKIDRLYNGGSDPGDAPVAGPKDWDYLPQVPLGDSSDLKAGDHIGVWGYPEDPGSQAPNFGSGQLSSTVEDQRLAPKWGTEANAAIWNFEGAQVLHGNSGGLVFDETTHTMVGIPTWYIPDHDAGAPSGSRMRPIDFVKPVLAAARAGRRYTTPYAVPHPASAKITKVVAVGTGYADNAVGSCDDAHTQAGSNALIAFDYTGFTGGQNLDLAAAVYVQDSSGQWNQVTSAMSQLHNQMKADGCVAFVFGENLPNGTYRIKVGVGGDLHDIYDYTGNVDWN
ncbi:MAG TPA: FHA domain-containing protein [Nocardioides sp.]|jgi:pSer/pThr/pTyr-binding forkhead associated (FHA) protein|uniref:FHA domain-containing protein n=1 Tax=Nocardioides sp. TaxID=35761 RepID=UPI002E3290C2|nr:FHA domain-containing protein [Nocardioides sp.]HEX3932968.1 FHA domain-containing protein [Nocardioides sp.]